MNPEFAFAARAGLVSLVLASLCHFSSPAHAEEGVHTSIHRQYQSPRAMGMGGAFVAVANDYSAVLYNPAGLARLEKWHFNGSIGVGLSAEQFLGFIQQLDQASKIENENDRFNATVEVLQKNYGKQFSLSAGLLQGSFVTTNWGLHVIPADLRLDMRVHNQGTPAINVRAFMDTTIAFGYGRAFAHENIPGRFSWGVTTKAVHRGYANKQVNALDLSLDPEVIKPSDLRDGMTVDFDLGLLYTPALPGDGLGSIFRLARPTFGVVLRNALDYGFTGAPGFLNTADTDPPEKLHRTLDFGTRFELPPFSIFSWRAVADVQDIMHPNYSFRKALHLGAEFDWTIAGWWKGQYRIGANQGYPTLGASFLLTVFRLDLLSYGEDIGGPNSPRENRMYKVVFNLDI
jgi:hypothetical protein